MNRSVPCNGCTACCEHDLIVLHPECGDDPATYDTQIVQHPFTGKPTFALKQKPEGGCVYLERGVGCTIHERAPAICKEFDCRRFVQRLSRDDRKLLLAKKMGDRAVMQAGFNRLHTLDRD